MKDIANALLNRFSLITTMILTWRRGGAVVNAVDFRSEVGGSTPNLCHRVVSLDKKLYPTLSLST